MARRKWVDGSLRVYSKWYAEGNFDYSIFDDFKTDKDLVEWFKARNYCGAYHDEVTTFLIDYIKKNNFKSVISFGAGFCGMEYLIKEALPDVNIVATEYEECMINAVKPFYKNMTCCTFDFFKDDIGDLKDNLGMDFDFAFFSASAYAMNDTQFLQMFRRLNECGIHDVIDNSGGVLYHKRYVRWYMHRLINAAYYLLNEELKYEASYIPENRPYGYGRTIPELRKFYRKAGYDVIDEPKIGTIKYIGILKSRSASKEKKKQ